MGFYDNLDNIINRMATMLLQNEDFVKYLYYNDPEPLSHEKVNNPLDLVGISLLKQPKSENIVKEEGTIVEIFFAGDKPSNSNSGLTTTYIITINIICHVNSWRINGGIRPYRLLSIIDSTFSGKKISDITLGQVVPLGSNGMKFADNWYGFKLNYSLTWSGNLRC